MLDGAQIRAAIVDKYFSDNHHWGQHDLADSRLTRIEHGRVTGDRWFVQRDRLCLTHASTVAPTECFAVQRHGDELLYVDEAGQGAWRGWLRDRSHAAFFRDVVDPPAPASRPNR